MKFYNFKELWMWDIDIFGKKYTFQIRKRYPFTIHLVQWISSNGEVRMGRGIIPWTRLY